MSAGILRRFRNDIAKALAGVLLAALFLLATAASCTHMAIREFDRWGDEKCRSGQWQGPELCPPGRFNTKDSTDT